MRVIDDLLADIRYAVRGLRRSPAFMLAAVVSLGLGIGANTAIFSVLDAVLLKSLPVRNPGELVIFTQRTGARAPNYALTFHLFQTFRDQTHTLSDVAASAGLRVNVETPGGPDQTIAARLVSGRYFPMLGVPAAIGRTLLPEDDGAPGGGAVVVLSHGFWQRRFGSDPQIIGKTIRLNAQLFTIVGVSAPEFFGTRVGEAPDVWVPLSMQAQVSADRGLEASLIQGDGAWDFWLELIGRRKPGVSPPQAQAELDGVFQQELPLMLARLGPKGGMLGKARLELEPGSKGLSELRKRFSQPLSVLMAVVSMVLLIACANVANLLLARAAVRRREIAIRVSLGASRSRLIRQSLTESLLLALLGGVLGLLVATWAGGALAALLAAGDHQTLAVPLDARVLAFTASVSVITGLAFGVAPAIRATGIDPQMALAASTRAAAGAHLRAGAGRWLVAAQVAMSLVLLVGAGLFVRTLMKLHDLDLGFDREHVLSVRVEPRGSNQKWQGQERLNRLYTDLIERVQRVPGVKSASLSGNSPLGNENPLQVPIAVAGYVPRAGEEVRLRLMQIYPSYFATLGIPLVAGRDLTPADNVMRDVRAAIVNETMAARFFGGSGAIGRQFTIAVNRVVFEVVGVVRDVRDRGPREEVLPMAYASFSQTTTGRGQMTLVVRTAGDPHAIVPAVRQHVAALDPGTPLFDVTTVAERVDAGLTQERTVALLSSIFGALAVVLACVGLYGVMAYAVARRSAEFGIRMALGADSGRVRRLVLSESLAVVAAGGAAGLLLSAAGATMLKRMLFGLEPWDPISFGAAGAILLATACLASYLPARHASRVDPMVALRQE